MAKLPNPPLDEPTAPPPAVIPELVPRKNMREEVLEVFYQMGGVGGMLAWAKSSTANERLFYSQILPKVIPREVNTNIGDGKGGPARLVVQWDTPPTDVTTPITQLMSAVTAMSAAIASEDD